MSKQVAITSLTTLYSSLAAWNISKKADHSTPEAFFDSYLAYKRKCGDETVAFINDNRDIALEQSAKFKVAKGEKIKAGLPYGPKGRSTASILKIWDVPPEMSYKDYLRSDHWQALRALMIKQRKNCSICSSTDKLNVHHNTYRVNNRRILGRERPKYLTVLCQRCHNLFHAYFKNPACSKQFFKLVRKRLAKGVPLEEAFRLAAETIRPRHIKAVQKQEAIPVFWQRTSHDIPLDYYLQRDE